MFTMNYVALWGIIAVILIGFEMFTCTFYLLMLALGAIVGAAAAWFGLSVEWQILLTAISAIAAASLLYLGRRNKAQANCYTENKNAFIDIGKQVEVKYWTPENTTQVQYRGAMWSAKWVGKDAPQTGQCVIRAMQGSQLQLDSVSAIPHS